MSTSRVLVVDDEADIRTLIQDILEDEGYQVTAAADAAAARTACDEGSFELVLLDIWMPDMDGITLLREWSERGSPSCPVVIMSGHGTVDTAVEATRLGAFDFVEKPLSIAKLLRTVERALEANKRKSAASRQLLPSLLAPVGRSRLMQNLRETVQRYAAHDSPVLLMGEPGTGRGAFAQYMHGLSPRADNSLEILLAASLTESNAEEQLFGSENGNGTVAGVFERAGEGTVIIDELCDLNDDAQKLVISALEKRRYTRRGGHDPIELKARVLATIREDFESDIIAGKLRRELVSAINTLSVRVPPLREYAEDVPELLNYYVDKLVDTEGLTFRRFNVAAQNRLRNYPWPDNVRELKNLVRRLLLTGSGEEVTLDEIESVITAATRDDEPLVKQDLLSLPLREAREQFERAYLQQQLVLCDGKVGKLAKRVGMERTHLYRKLRSLGVDFRSIGASSDD